jgi:type VI secretion system lysozyme-like protein
MRFLLERLAEAAAGVEHTDLAAAVAAQIQRIVATRSWDAGDADLLGFGMPSVVELGSANVVQLKRYAERLARLIARYEPRLANVQVEVEAAQGALTPYRLLVSATLQPQGEQHMFHFLVPGH